MKIFDPKLTGSIEILNTISGNVTIAGGLTVEGSLGGSATTASYVEYSDIANKPTLVSSSAQIASDISGSFTGLSSSLEQRVSANEGSISSLNQASSSYALQADISGSFTSVSSSLASRISLNEGSVNSLNQASSSYLLNTTDTLVGDLTVTGTLTAQEFHTEFVSASIMYQSGSTKFGNSTDDKHSMTGSLQVSGSSHYILGGVSINKETADTTLDVGGSITGLGLRTNSTNTNYNFISRDSAGNALFVQSVQSNSNQNIATFQYGSATVNAGNIVLQVSKDISYFTNTNVGIGTTTPSSRLQIDKSSQTIGGTTPNGALLVSSLTAGNAVLEIGVDPTSLSYLQSRNITSNTPYQLLLNPDGGNVGIGTTSPAEKLHINGNIRLFSAGYPYIDMGVATDNYFRLINDNPNDTFLIQKNGSTLVTFTAGGSVGIGTTSPSTILDINGNLNSGFYSLMKNASNGSSAYTSYSAKNDANKVIDLGIQSSTRTSGYPAGTSYVYTDSTALNVGYSGYTTIYAGNSERMRITSGGNVGIGTTSPTAKLNVSGVSTGAAIDWTNTTATTGRSFRWVSLNAGGFAVEDLTASGANRFTINASGNIGIGTTSPQRKLVISNGGANGIEIDPNISGTAEIIAYNRSTSAYQPLHFEASRYYLGSGNVGIGNTTPQAKLDLGTSIGGNYRNSFFFYNDNNTGPYYGTKNGFYMDQFSLSNNTTLAFSTAAGAPGTLMFASKNTEVNDSSSLTTRMTIAGETGNVGIGTTSPTDTLNYGKALDIQSSTGAAVYLRDLTDTAKYGLIAYDGESNNRTSIGAIGTDNYLRFVTVSTEAMRITSAGNIVTGEMSTDGTFNPNNNGWYLGYNGGGGTVVNFSNTNEAFIYNQRDGLGTTEIDFRNGDVERGKISWTTSGTTYNTSSDYRLKTNINPLTGALAKIALLAPKTFNYIDGNGQLISGFIAHEVQEVVPEAVTGQKDEVREDGTPKYQGMDHSRLVPFLVAAMQEQQALIEDLKSRLEALEQV